MKKSEFIDLIKDIVSEGWDKEVEVKSTGEHADKTITQIKKEMKALKGKKPFNREQFSELMFALRAKQGWKKGKGATGTTEHITKMKTEELKELVREEVSKAKIKKEYQHIKDAYYNFSDGVYGLLDMTYEESGFDKDPVVKKTFREAKKLLMNLDSHLDKNYKGWE
tara:strand:- start:311 stop:811 length:501 start_codon:yes stop_codon:yes gene_type:complete